VTSTGVEGGLIYAASSRLRHELDSKGSASFVLDLAPDSPRENLVASLSRPRGSRSMASHLERTVGVKGVKAGLLYEFLPKEDIGDPEKLASAIKGLKIPVTATRPIEEAISSAGGVKFEELDSRLMIKKLPGVFCAGEMLDWDAPTGGYLLTACFATGRAAGQGALEWLV
jgi:predicted flavoprotein YhiN